ncbi:MATE family efflux transporter [Photobacterium alginatilyticum]|uniref:MATE family efflux transporter n=1 Tax=Photobacterium alginatilyticum TaxID=1775171 RepID=UPI00406863F0
MVEQSYSYYLRRLVVLGVPLMLQSLLFSSLGFIDNLMVSQLGTQEVAASGIGARVFWLASACIWGMGTGMGVLLAQYWGARDEEGLKRNFALGVAIATLASSLFLLVCGFFPTFIPGLFEPSAETMELAAGYVQLLGIAIFLAGPTITLDAALRSIGQTKINLYISLVEIGLNIVLNYVLIFGHLGAPALGLIGAGVGTVIARSIRVVILLVVIYRFYPVLAFGISHLISAFHQKIVKRYFEISLPIIAGSLIWSGGMFTYHLLLGRIGEVELATMAILTPLESFALSVAHGLSSATAILVGNSLGSGKFSLSRTYSTYVLKTSVAVGVALGGLLLLAEALIISLYTEVSSEVLELASRCFPVLALSILLRTVNITVIVGVLRAGGDAKFCMNMDIVCQWLWAIPVTAFAAIWLEWSLPLVLLMMTSEELVKLYPAMRRLASLRWVNNLTEDPEKEEKSPLPST